MKKTLLIILLSCFSLGTYAQEKEAAEKLVNEGIAYHDKGDYDGAISKYDEALKLDKDNLLALAEKAYTLLSQDKNEECISYCQKSITIHPDDDDLKSVYVTYGNALDGLKKTDQSIEIYNEGIKHFPNYYMLHFNKGISLASVKKYDESLLCFEKAVILNPNHASSHNAIARISKVNNKRIASLMAYFRFMSLEPQSKRAEENLGSIQKLMNSNVEKTGKKSITIKINPNLLGDTNEFGKPNANNFSTVDMILSMSSALDYDKKNKKKTEVELFTNKLETICASLNETKKDNFGFYWEYYAPYFIEMKDKNLLETFSYIVYASSEDKNIQKWIKSHDKQIDDFFDWSNAYDWKKF